MDANVRLVIGTDPVAVKDAEQPDVQVRSPHVVQVIVNVAPGAVATVHKPL